MGDFSMEYKNNIDEISQELYEYFLKLKLKHGFALKNKLYFENIMLDLKEHGVTNFLVSVDKSISNIKVHIQYSGDAFDPFSDLDSEDKQCSQIIYRNLGMESTYAYRKSMNTIITQCKIPLQLDNLSIFLPVILAAVFAIVLRIFFVDYCIVIKDGIVVPLFGLFLKLLVLVVVPIVFFSQIVTIASFENVKEIKSTANLFFKRSIAILLILGVISAMVTFLIWGKIDNSVFIGNVQFSVSTIVGAVPQSVLQPIITGNILQILVFATIAGCGLLSIGERKTTILTLCKDANDVSTYALRLLCKLMPAFMFFSIMNVFLSVNLAEFYNVLLCIGFLILMALLIALIYAKGVSWSTNTKLKDLWLFLRKPVLVALSTASSYAARGDMYDAANHTPNPEKKNFIFFINIGGVIFRTATVVSFIVIAIFFKQTLSLPMLIVLVPLSIFVAAATPPIPAADIVTAAIVFNVMGVDIESIMPVFILTSLLIDHVFTAVDVACLLLECYYCDYKLYSAASKM